MNYLEELAKADYKGIVTTDNLIESCGEYFKRLRRIKDIKKGKVIWKSTARVNGKNLDDFIGETKEESLAKMWLDLKVRVVNGKDIIK